MKRLANLGGGEASAAKAREKFEKRVIQSSAQPSAARDLE